MIAAAASLRAFLRVHTGVHLEEDKDYLVVSRLRPLITADGPRDLMELAQIVLRDPKGPLALQAIDALTTHETSWFRDTRPFVLLRDQVLPTLRELRSAASPLTLWSAACSTGQEPYSIAMTLLDAGWRPEEFSLLASDVSPAVLVKARDGLYTDFELQRGLPDDARHRHFRRQGAHWSVEPAVRQSIRFQTVNLIDQSYIIDDLDVIFCRNVLIYFDAETRRRVLQALRQRLNPGGFLFLGAAESPLGQVEGLVACAQAPGLYRRCD